MSGFSVAALFIRYLKLKTKPAVNISKAEYKPYTWDKPDGEEKSSFSALELEAISDWAFSGEKLFHGTPSGTYPTLCNTYQNELDIFKDLTTLSALTAIWSSFAKTTQPPT